MIIDSITREFKRYRKLAEGAIRQVPANDLTRVIAADGNSLSVLAGHISGNLKSRFTDFLTSDGEKEWRQRDSEFEEDGLDHAGVEKVLAEGWQVLFDTLDSLSDADIHQIVTIRAVEFTVLEALHRSLAHISYHVGQIVLIARVICGDNWQSLSIPRGGSAAYNQNPTRERG